MSNKGWIVGGIEYTADQALQMLLQIGLITPTDFANYYGRCRYSDTMYIVNEEGVPVPIVNPHPKEVHKPQVTMEPVEEQVQKTIGELRVRTDFNVSGSDIITQIKAQSADLINLCEELKAKDPRLASLAQTAYEEAAMWAVKAATA